MNDEYDGPPERPTIPPERPAIPPQATRTYGGLDDLPDLPELPPSMRSAITQMPHRVKVDLPKPSPSISVEPPRVIPAPRIVTDVPAPVPLPAVDATVPAPQPKWIGEALGNLFAPSRRKGAIAAAAGTLVLGALGVQVVLTGKSDGGRTTATTEQPIAKLSPMPVPAEVKKPSSEEKPDVNPMPVVVVPPLPDIPAPAPVHGTEPPPRINIPAVRPGTIPEPDLNAFNGGGLPSVVAPPAVGPTGSNTILPAKFETPAPMPLTAPTVPTPPVTSPGGMTPVPVLPPTGPTAEPPAVPVAPITLPGVSVPPPPSTTPSVTAPVTPTMPPSTVPVVPSTPAPVVPATPAPVVPTTPAPVVPATTAPVVPSVPGSVVPSVPGPVVPSTPAPALTVPVIPPPTSLNNIPPAPTNPVDRVVPVAPATKPAEPMPVTSLNPMPIAEPGKFPSAAPSSNPNPSAEKLGGFTMTKPIGGETVASFPPVPAPQPTLPRTSGTEVRTSFDVDLHRVEDGDTYEAISRKHYGDVKYAEVLRRFNGNRGLAKGSDVELPPTGELRKRMNSLAPIPAVGVPTRPVSPDGWTAPPANAAPKYYTVARDGMSFWDVAEEAAGDRKDAAKVRELNPKIDPNIRFKKGDQVRVK